MITPSDANESVKILVDNYHCVLQKNGFLADEGQLAVVHSFASLRDCCIKNNLLNKSLGSRLFRWIKGGSWLPCRGLYLHGGVGCGKTFLTNQFFTSLPFKEKKRIHFYEFMEDTMQRLRAIPDTPHPVQNIIKDMSKRIRLIYIDEFLVTDIFHAILLYRLLNAMIKYNMVLVATSNFRPCELYRGGFQRDRFLPAIDLLEKHNEVTELCSTKDYRQTFLLNRETFLTPINAKSHAKLGVMFDHATFGDVVTGPLFINQHKLKIVKASENILWVYFQELCEKPRSNSDYLHIARRYQILLVSGLFAMDDSDDIARRFIGAIDVLYEHGVKLAFSSEVPISKLYPQQGGLAFEFMRTKSRLREMQSTRYLQLIHR